MFLRAEMHEVKIKKKGRFDLEMRRLI